ncbi:MAG: hypothetical protein FWE06_06970 [Oscillospiraceae bacterium]|nr:hypothetical protein [Oscillospiraceae bacterium]
MSIPKKAKPIIEESISKYLDGDMKITALDFVVYLRTIKLQPVWTAWNTWKVSYKGEVICTVHLLPEQKNPWAVALYLDCLNDTNKYEDLIMGEGLQKIIFDNVVYCIYSSNGSGTGCSSNKPCVGGESRIILGKEIEGVCHFSRTFTLVENPSETVINGIKRLIELEKTARSEVPKKVVKHNDVQKAEQDVKPLHECQKNTRPQIEDIAGKALVGERLDNLLNFVTWLRANKISPAWATKNNWMVSVKGKRTCYIRVSQLDGIFTGSWWVSFSCEGLADENLIADERIKEIVWSNVRTCKVCNSCFPGGNKTILGKEMERVCGLAAPDFWNPDAEEIECAKQLILAKREL